MELEFVTLRELDVECGLNDEEYEESDYEEPTEPYDEEGSFC